MIKIPDEVVEAAEKTYQAAWELDELANPKEWFRAAIAAGLAAWPGMHVHETRRSWLGGFSERELMLPLPTEARDE